MMAAIPADIRRSGDTFMRSPQRLRDGRRHTARWIRAEVRAWVADRIADARGDRPPVDDTDITLIAIAEVCRIAGIGRSTVYDLVAAGRFPPQVGIDIRARDRAA